jgi:hypothetical protein
MTGGSASAQAYGLALVLTVLALTACGRPGPPVSPERVSPLPAADLSAVVLHRAIEIGWTMPSRRADNARLRDLVAMHVFRAEDDGAGDPKPALVSRGRVAGYAEVATVRLVDPAPAVIAGTRVTLVDRASMNPGRRYTYVVLAEDARGHVSPPSPRLSVVLIAPPVAPADVRALPGDREVRLEWRPSPALQDGARADELFAYEILRGVAPETPRAVIATTGTGATSFVDRNLDNETAYVYAVRALRPARDTVARGELSGTTTATPVDSTPPAAPTELVGIPSASAVRLVWMASPDPDVARYIVYRGREEAPLERVGSTTAPGTTFTDREVPAGRWRYAVSAQDSSSRANESTRSVEVTVTVP